MMNMLIENRTTVLTPFSSGDNKKWMDTIKDVVGELQDLPGCGDYDVWENLDLPALKKRLASIYMEQYCKLLDTQTGCYDDSTRLSFLRLVGDDFICFTIPVEKIDILWNLTDKDVFAKVVKKLYGVWVDLLQCPSRSHRFFTLPPGDWDEVELGMMFIAFLQCNGLLSTDVEDEIHDRLINSGAVHFAVLQCLNVHEERLKKMEAEAHVYFQVKKKMEDAFWVENSVNLLQESLIDYNEDVIPLIREVVMTYQSSAGWDERETPVMVASRPFWEALNQHAREEACREIDGNEDEFD